MRAGFGTDARPRCPAGPRSCPRSRWDRACERPCRRWSPAHPAGARHPRCARGARRGVPRDRSSWVPRRCSDRHPSRLDEIRPGDGGVQSAPRVRPHAPTAGPPRAPPVDGGSAAGSTRRRHTRFDRHVVMRVHTDDSLPSGAGRDAGTGRRGDEWLRRPLPVRDRGRGRARESVALVRAQCRDVGGYEHRSILAVGRRGRSRAGPGNGASVGAPRRCDARPSDGGGPRDGGVVAGTCDGAVGTLVASRS